MALKSAACGEGLLHPFVLLPESFGGLVTAGDLGRGSDRSPGRRDGAGYVVALCRGTGGARCRTRRGAVPPLHPSPTLPRVTSVRA